MMAMASIVRPSLSVGAMLAALRPSPAWAYTLRVLLAVTLAMYAAYWLELDSPYSAGTTVLVVMNSSRGAIISKSIWRVAGSIVGATAAVVLIALFAQAPVLFIFGLAAWVGVCTFVASLLRYNRSYGAVLAGYTVTLVAFGAIADPERIFELATARVAVVTIGVLSTALVFLITDRGPGRQDLEARMVRLIAAAASVLSDALRSGDLTKAAIARRRMAADLLAIDQVVEFAAIEDAGFGRYKGDLRLAFAEIFAALTGGLHTIDLVRQSSERTALQGALGQIAALDSAASAAVLRRSVQDTVTRLQQHAATCRDIAALSALDQSAALLMRFDAGLGSLQALQEGIPRTAPIHLRNFVNPVTAWRNGLRAAIAIIIAGLFWIISQWPQGGAMLTLLGPVAALASQADSAAGASVDFLKGTMLAVIAGFICTYGILPQTTGFPLLMAAMLPFIAVGVLVSRVPRYGIVGLGFLVFFVTAVAPANPMHYDVAASINTYVAFVVGAACAVLAFRVLLPPNPIAEARVLAEALRRSVQRLAALRRSPHMLIWEHLQHQKLVRLSRRLANLPAQQADAVANGIAAVVVGRHLAALRLAARDATLPPTVRAAASRTADSFRHVLTAPGQAADMARTEATRINHPDAPQAVLHVLATLHDLAAVMSGHLDFFARGAAA